MIRHIDNKTLGRGKHIWLDSHFHFSFAEYCNADNIDFGVLRVVNDDIVQPQTGFDTHSHKDMEIISYVVDGELTHGDSMDNNRILKRGQVQYMSAGTGVRHSEHNLNKKEALRFLQIWIYPDKDGYAPNYGDHLFEITDRLDKWLHIATKEGNINSDAPIKIHQDVNLYATIISENNTMEFEVAIGRQAYLVFIEGNADINGINFEPRDGGEITEETIIIKSKATSHLIIIEMEKV
jgi:redox-sensitive bicupin YhaK (pirin superfamily)